MAVTATDSRAERFLGSIGARFKWVNDLSFSDLEKNWDAKNLGRSAPRDECAIKHYGQLLHQGSPAPGMILGDDESGHGLSVLDGVQRLVSIELSGCSVFSAYVVYSTSNLTFKKIRVVANSRLQGGHQETAEWSITQAVRELILLEGLSVADVAELGGWPPSKLRRKVEDQKCIMMVECCGGPTITEALASRIRASSNGVQLEDIPDITRELTTILTNKCTSAEESQSYLEEFFARPGNKMPGRNEWLRRLDNLRHGLQRPKTTLPAETKFNASLIRCVNSVKALVASGDIITGCEDYYRKLNIIRDQLKEMEKRCRIKKKHL